MESKRNEGWEYLYLCSGYNCLETARGLGIPEDRSAEYVDGEASKGIKFLNRKITAARQGDSVAITADDKKKLLQLGSGRNDRGL